MTVVTMPVSGEPVALADKSSLSCKSSVTDTRVDFSRFRPLKAKVDCIVFACRLADFEKDRLMEIDASIKDGTLTVPTDRNKWGERKRPYLTVHDPSPRDLQYLVERFWDQQIIKIEFAVDAHLPSGSNDLYLLKQLKGQLRHCLFPQAHSRLPKAKRKYFAIGVGKKTVRHDAVGTPLPDTQIIWEQTSVDDKLALYIKEFDQKKSVGQPWVRMEARLEGSGLPIAGLGRVGMLSNFAPRLRTYLGPMFTVAGGFKSCDQRTTRRAASTDAWPASGAQWAAKRAVKLEADVDAKKHIGAALNDLRRSLMRLTPPSAVAHRYDEWIDEMTY